MKVETDIIASIAVIGQAVMLTISLDVSCDQRKSAQITDKVIQ